MAVLGHSGSQAPQLMHSLVIIVAIDAKPPGQCAKGLTNFTETVKRNAPGARARHRFAAVQRPRLPSSSGRAVSAARRRRPFAHGTLDGRVLLNPQPAALPPGLHGTSQLGEAFDP